MTERPLPLFGAGAEAGVAAAGVVLAGVMISGLISWTTLACIGVGGAIIYGVRQLREVDPFGVESFLVGVTTPSRFQKGTDLTRTPSSPRPSRPVADPS
jgi:hypothetical protein